LIANGIEGVAIVSLSRSQLKHSCKKPDGWVVSGANLSITTMLIFCTPGSF